VPPDPSGQRIAPDQQPPERDATAWELRPVDEPASPALATFARRCVAHPREVAGLRTGVVAFAAASGLSADTQADVALAVSEACTNVLMHAYLGTDPGPMTVEAFPEDGELVVLVVDEGRGMVPRADSPGMGLGLPLIARVASRLEISGLTGTHGTTVRMTFALSPNGA
jgi:serine/threonine-protein kinase RsbW